MLKDTIEGDFYFGQIWDFFEHAHSIKACNIMRRKGRLYRHVCMMLCVYSKVNVTVGEDTAFPLVRKKKDLKWQKGKMWAFFPPSCLLILAQASNRSLCKYS